MKKVLTNRILPELQRVKKASATDKGGEDLLRRFSCHWINYKIFVKWMQQLFRHLDNGYVANSSIATLTSVGLNLFQDTVFTHLKKEVRNSLVDAIERDRDGKAVDFDLVRNCVNVFSTMGLCSKFMDLKTIQAAMLVQPDLHIYQTDFETYLLEKTSAYYARQSQQWLETNSTPIYLKKAEVALKTEAKRVHSYLHASTESKLLTVCEAEMLQAHEKTLISQETSGMNALLAQDQDDDLKRMFKLFRRIPQGLSPMALTFRQFVFTKGNDILQRRLKLLEHLKAEGKSTSIDDPITVETLLSLHRKMKKMVAEHFGKDTKFQRALREALQDVLNADAPLDQHGSNVQILVAYTDRVLCGKMKVGEEDLEKVLDELIDLFLLISDKDLYSELYREQLAKRLLSQKYVSLHTEKAMIIRMKTQQGAPFTTKLEGMINDFTVGGDLDRMWRAHGDLANDKIQFSVRVLTQGFWPTQKHRELHLSREMITAKVGFDAWYKDKHSHRILSWVYVLGDVAVKGTFETRSYTMTLTTFQAMALLCFSDSWCDLTLRDICEQIHVDSATGKRVLHSLACGKYKVLRKTGNPRTINSSKDQFSAENSFISKLRRFVIQMSPLDGDSKKKIDHDLLQQRCYNVDAM